MAKSINTQINSGILKFTFTDSNGEVFASFRMNPTDIRIAKRCEGVGNRIDKMAEEADKSGPADYEEAMEQVFCDVLGYDVRNDLFGIMSATTLLPDGDIFASKIITTIAAAVQPEIERRAKKMQGAMSKYTDKYNT